VVSRRNSRSRAGFELTSSGGSAATTIEISKDAAAAGATHAIVICPGYFSFAMGRDRAAIIDFFNRVMDASPIPVMIYNFP
jgi:dihydrodipicolinate synthase/N-acetylneuraminate lyase